MIKRLEQMAKFFEAATNLINRGVSKDGIVNFAKQEFGEVSDLMLARINQLFRKKESGDLPSLKREPIEDNVTEVFFGPGDKRLQGKRSPKAGLEKLVDESGDIEFSIPSQGINKQKGTADEIMNYISTNPYRAGGALDPSVGMTRTAARVVLGNSGIKVPEKADPIKIFEANFGGRALLDLRDAAEELIEKEKRGRITESMGEFLESRGLFNLIPNKSIREGMTDEEFRAFLKEKGVDPDDTGFKEGGRVGYAFGSGIRLAKYLAIRGKTLKDEIKKAIDNFIQPSGDTKYDADVVLDDMLEELGTSRSEIDQKDIIDAYGQIYDEMIQPVVATLKNKPEAMTPKLIERFTLKEKYPGIDEDLLTSIIDDPNPQRKAEVLATLDQSMEMMKQGKGSEEIVDILKQETKRKDNAEGGLNYLMGM